MKPTALCLPCLIFLLISCGDSEDEAPAFVRTVSGTVSNTTSVKVGAFSSDYWFTSSSPDDVVAGGELAGSYVPLVVVIPGVDGSYSIDLPESPDEMGELIAWIDNDGNGDFDLGTEAGYFARKAINSVERTIVGFGWIIYGGTRYYLVSYDDGEVMNNDGFDIIGNGGFNFYID